MQGHDLTHVNDLKNSLARSGEFFRYGPFFLCGWEGGRRECDCCGEVGGGRCKLWLAGLWMEEINNDQAVAGNES